MDEVLFAKICDCFTAGYTLPQYCIDNGIKKPLFVSEGKYKLFVWQVYVQFHYDKRLSAQFCFLDISKEEVAFSVLAIINSLKIKHISEINPAEFDAIILLTQKKVNLIGKIISVYSLKDFLIKRTYFEIPILNFLQRYPYVKLFLTNFPSLMNYEDRLKFNSQLYEGRDLFKILCNRKTNNIKTSFDNLGYSNQEVYEIMQLPKLTRNLDGTTLLIDNDTNPWMGIQNGKRKTAYQPEKFLNKIYIVGTCHHYGFYAPYHKTIASYLQKLLTENNLPYRVENEGQAYFGRYQDIFYNLNKITPAPGDIIFVFLQSYSHKNDDIIPFCDVKDAFDPPHDYKEIYCVKWHINELGYKLLAERYFDFLTKNNFFRDVELKYPAPPPHAITDMVYLLGQSRAA